MEYQPQTKNCQNCKKDFIIELEDFLFYEKIKVPAPTFCPECRMIRRMMWRNLRSLYKRNCNLCKKNIISLYSGLDKAPVLCSECYTSDNWDQYENGKDYDFEKPFFVQLKDLWKKNPRLYSVKVGSLINSEYTNFSKNNKNAYLSFSVMDSEDIMYSESISFSKNSLDSYSCIKLDNSYYNINCEGNYNTLYAIESNNCIDSLFIYDCVNCQNCFLSYNLRNKKYFFKNKPLSKEDYNKKLEEYNIKLYTNILKALEEFKENIKYKAIHKYANIYASQNVTGNYIHNSKNFKECFDTFDGENVAYAIRSGVNLKDSYDILGTTYNVEMVYEGVGVTTNVYNDHFNYFLIGCRDCEYSGGLKNCNNCFGCFSLSNASYCILNKQYSKEDYSQITERIKKHMDDMPYTDEKGRVYKYGEFFPFDFSSFGYNETIANNFFQLNKNDILEKGYPFKDLEEKNYGITINSSDLSDSLKDINDNIINEIISCPNNGDEKYQCTTAYRIMPEELQFYKQKGLPLPRYCPNCRHYQRLEYINPMKLWHRQCMKPGCTNEFETSYAPDRPEIIYCEKCYQGEVY